MDHLFTLNELTPKIKCNGCNGVDPNLVFGIGAGMAKERLLSLAPDSSHNDEVETIHLRSLPASNCDSIPCSDCVSCFHQSVHFKGISLPTHTSLTHALSLLSTEYVWRVKGFVQLQPLSSTYILNWAFGRYQLHQTDKCLYTPVELTLMGDRGSLKDAVKSFVEQLDLEIL